MPGEEASSTPEVRRALLIAVAKVKGFADLRQAHKDVLRLRTFLIRGMHQFCDRTFIEIKPLLQNVTTDLKTLYS